MNFLKTHFEKIIFGAVLAAFFASLIITRPWARIESIGKGNDSPGGGKPVQEIKYDPEKILGKLNMPFRWGEGSDTLPYLFTPNHRVIEYSRTTGLKTEKIARAVPLGKLKKTGDGTFKTRQYGPITTVEKALSVLEIADRPLRIQFRGFSNPTGTKRRFQINFFSEAHQGKEDTQFANEGETIEGFALKQYRQKMDKGQDVSELDVQRGQEPVATLVFNVIKEAGTELIATIQDAASGTPRKYKIGDKLFAELETGVLELKIVDMKPTHVVLEETKAPDKKYTLTKAAR